MATDERRIREGSPASEPSSEQVAKRRQDWATFWNDPFALWNSASPFRRAAHEMDRWFHEATHAQRRGQWPSAPMTQGWTPDVESFQRGDQFIIRADLPGMNKDDLAVTITDDN